MHFFTAAVAALSTAQVVLGGHVGSRSPYVVKETHFVPSRWNKIGIPHPEHTINLKIAMKNNRFHELERHLYEVSDPSHHRYGKHLSAEEVDELVKPSEHASSQVDEWLYEHGILPEQRQYSTGKQWITITLPVSQVEELLQTKYAVYRHEEGNIAVRATSWSLPRHLHDHIATIQPTTAFMRSSPQADTVLALPDKYSVADLKLDSPYGGGDVNAACNFSMVTSGCLRTLYKTINYKPQVPTKNQIGFTNYLGEITNRTDTAIAMQKYRPDAVPGAYAYKEVSIDGGPIEDGSPNGGIEAALDQQTIIGITYPINVTSYSTGGEPPFIPDINTPTDTNEPYLVWLNYVSAQKFIPQTITTSYGDDEQTVPRSYAESVCQGLAALGARGVSLLYSSGDDGVGGNGTCFSNDGRNATMWIPNFPASCPYVTTVGATRNYPEVVAYDSRNGYVSGAGFSNYFKTPSYQAGVVQSYVKSLGGQFDGLYNKTGRAYPDLAAQGYRYAVIVNNTVRAVDGTSASCPTMGSVISLVNDALVAAGKPPLGFLNPWLYGGAGAKAFTDVVSGTTTGCNSSGFPAGPGWDAASGWGTPDFVKILKTLGVGGGYWESFKA